MNRLHSANRLTAYRAECLARLSFDVLDACGIRGEQAPGMDRTTNQSFYGKSILDKIQLQVCSLVHSLTNCWRGASSVEER